jgi:ankyrin repeat protein
MADVMAPDQPAQRLLQAVKDGRSGDVQRLVEDDPALAATCDVSGVSAILLALYHGHAQIAEWLAARRSDLDIFEAASLGDVRCVRALLSADPSLAEAWSPDGFTALALASFFGRLPVVRVLVARGADVNAIGRNAARYTALTGAVTGRHAEVVRELLQDGADPNHRYGSGLTPLHVAAVNGSVEIAQSLVEAGARIDTQADDGKTPLDYAREKGRLQVADLLTGRGPR